MENRALSISLEVEEVTQNNQFKYLDSIIECNNKLDGEVNNMKEKSAR